MIRTNHRDDNHYHHRPSLPSPSHGRTERKNGCGELPPSAGDWVVRAVPAVALRHAGDRMCRPRGRRTRGIECLRRQPGPRGCLSPEQVPKLAKKIAQVRERLETSLVASLDAPANTVLQFLAQEEDKLDEHRERAAKLMEYQVVCPRAIRGAGGACPLTNESIAVGPGSTEATGRGDSPCTRRCGLVAGKRDPPRAGEAVRVVAASASAETSRRPRWTSPVTNSRGSPPGRSDQSSSAPLAGRWPIELVAESSERSRGRFDGKPTGWGEGAGLVSPRLTPGSLSLSTVLSSCDRAYRNFSHGDPRRR